MQTRISSSTLHTHHWFIETAGSRSSARCGCGQEKFFQNGWADEAPRAALDEQTPCAMPEALSQR
jgi:hypothetical protein